MIVSVCTQDACPNEYTNSDVFVENACIFVCSFECVFFTFSSSSTHLLSPPPLLTASTNMQYTHMYIGTHTQRPYSKPSIQNVKHRRAGATRMSENERMEE